MSSIDYADTVKNTHTNLKPNALNFWEVLAQAIALISPSMTAALIVPLMFGTAGTAGWLCYLFGTVMLLFVAISLNQFAKRYTSAGSMYEYTVKGLGPEGRRHVRLVPDLGIHVHRHRRRHRLHALRLASCSRRPARPVSLPSVDHAVRDLRCLRPGSWPTRTSPSPRS